MQANVKPYKKNWTDYIHSVIDVSTKLIRSANCLTGLWPTNTGLSRNNFSTLRLL